MRKKCKEAIDITDSKERIFRENQIRVEDGQETYLAHTNLRWIRHAHLFYYQESDEKNREYFETESTIDIEWAEVVNKLNLQNLRQRSNQWRKISRI